MALKHRPIGHGFGIGGWDIGRVHETRGGPEHLRWFGQSAMAPSTSAGWPRGWVSQLEPARPE